MTQMMTEEDASSLGSTLEDGHDALKDYIADYVRQLYTQVRIYSYQMLASPCSLWECLARSTLNLNVLGRALAKSCCCVFWLLFYLKDVLDLDWTTTDVFRFSSVRPLKVSRISTVLKQIFRFLINSLVFT